jgi:hypothetical protein
MLVVMIPLEMGGTDCHACLLVNILKLRQQPLQFELPINHANAKTKHNIYHPICTTKVNWSKTMVYFLNRLANALQCTLTRNSNDPWKPVWFQNEGMLMMMPDNNSKIFFIK